ncbi:MAG: Ig-like domain-containing protein [Bacteroidales bacterium]|nr:Ig-like domain-containing protein [Bacteroidales bacterium]
MKRLVAIIAVAALFFSCVKEVVEPGMRISGTYAYYDGTGLSNLYVSFEDGYYSQVVLSKSLSYMEDSFWGYSKSYETVYKKPYSIRDGNLIVAGQPRGVVELKEDYLYLQGKTYSKVKAFNKELYSSIVLPEGTAKTISYESKEYAVPVTINRPIPTGTLNTSTTASWISGIKVQDGYLKFSASETKVDRTATIGLFYTNADEVTLSVAQRPSTFIKLGEHERTVSYIQSSQSLSYTIENPLPGSALDVSCTSNWVKNIVVGAESVTFDVEEHPGSSSRIATLICSYSGAADVSFTLTQSGAVTAIVPTPYSQSCTYTGGDFSFNFTVENPRQGISVTATSQSSWITGVTISGNTVSYKVAENNSGSYRNGKILLSYGNLATKEFTVFQYWSAAVITTIPTSQNVTYTGGSFSLEFSVSNPREGAAVTASSQSDWITDVSISGNTVSYRVSENNSGSSRTGRIKLSYGTFATKLFTVSQSWSAATIITTPASQEVTYSGGNFSLEFSVSNPREGVSVTASSLSDWITNVSVSGNSVSYKVAENNSGSSRTGKIKLSYGPLTTKEFSVSQAWSASEIITTPAGQEVTYTGGSFSLDFSVSNPREGATVTASSQSDWITDVNISGNKAIYKVAENNSSAQRLGSIKLSYGTYDTKSFSVTQTGKPVQSITLNKSSLELYAGNSETLTATVDPSDAVLSWSSSDKSVATVSSSGVVTGVSRGTATITLSATDGSGVSKTCEVEVKQFVTGISLNKTSLFLLEGDSETLSATVTPDNANDKTLTWSSSNTSVATMDQAGKVTAVSEGTATITATANDGSGKKATCLVLVGTDLSSSESANCYIVSSVGAYRFNTVKGNSSTSVGSVSKAEVLWESFGTSTAPSKGDIISNVSYSGNYIIFETPSTLKNGNAVIAAKDASGNVLWSWHIWVCKDYAPASTAQEYFNNAGTMMDRNLGATSATPGDVGALGLLYQWGRKDPFLGSSSISSSTNAKSTLSSWPSPVSSTSSNRTIEYAVKNPTTFIKGVSSSNYDWYYTGSSSTDNKRWQTSKTIYDPCPPGWKVPAGGSSGVWSKAAKTSSEFSHTWDSTNKGMNFSNKFGSAGTIWYPAAGYLKYDDGSLISVGTSGRWWSCAPNDLNAYFLYLYYYGYVYPSAYSLRAYGQSVRCLQE